MFDGVVDELQAARETMLVVGRKAVKDAIKAFMEAHPEVARMRFYLSIPSFNDGDPCVLTLGKPEVILANPKDNVVVAVSADPIPAITDDDTVDEEDDIDDEGDGEDFDDVDEDLYLGSWSSEIRNTPLAADLDSLNDVLNAGIDAAGDIFGKASEVHVGPGGETRVRSYYCD